MYLNTFNFDFDSLKNLPKLINYVGAEPTSYESNSITLRFSKSQDNIEEPPTNNCSETDSALINLIGFPSSIKFGELNGLAFNGLCIFVTTNFWSRLILIAGSSKVNIALSISSWLSPVKTKKPYLLLIGF